MDAIFNGITRLVVTFFAIIIIAYLVIYLLIHAFLYIALPLLALYITYKVLKKIFS